MLFEPQSFIQYKLNKSFDMTTMLNAFRIVKGEMDIQEKLFY